VALVLIAAVVGTACNTDTREASLPATTSTAPISVVPATTCTASPRPPTTRDYNAIAGVDHTLLSLDVYPLPATCGARPVLFWIHGGAWAVGDKRNNISDKARLAASYGWVLVSVNYRLSTTGAKVVWPDHGEDVAAAVGYTLDHAQEFGIDPQHVALMGHSAGGHLAAILAVDPGLLKAVHHSRDEVDCLVALDTEGYDIPAIIGSGDASSIAMIKNAFGTDSQTYRKASPNFVLAHERGRVADALIITRGPVDRQAVAVDFADLVRANGAVATVVVADGYSHADVNTAVGVVDDTVVNVPVTHFLTSCLG